MIVGYKARDKRLHHISIIPDIPIRRISENVGQINEWIEPVLLSRLNQAENDGTGFCPTRGIGKQEILPVYDKRLN